MIKKCFSDVYKKTNWSSWFFLILFDSSLNLSARKTNNPCILFCRLWYLTFVQFNIYRFFNTPSRTLSIGDLVVFFYNITMFIIPISFFYAYSTLIKFIHIYVWKRKIENGWLFSCYQLQCCTLNWSVSLFVLSLFWKT